MAEGKQNLQNAAIIAKLFGVTDRRIQQLAKEGIIPATQKRPYMFDLLPTVQSYIRYLSDKANGREAKSADAAQVEMEKLRAEADMKRSKADMAAMQLKELEGKPRLMKCHSMRWIRYHPEKCGTRTSTAWGRARSMSWGRVKA